MKFSKIKSFLTTCNEATLEEERVVETICDTVAGKHGPLHHFIALFFVGTDPVIMENDNHFAVDSSKNYLVRIFCITCFSYFPIGSLRFSLLLYNKQENILYHLTPLETLFLLQYPIYCFSSTILYSTNFINSLVVI